MADRLTNLRLALVLGWSLPQWFVRNGWPQLVERCKDEVLPWSIGDDELDFYLLRSDRHERASNFRREGQRPTIH